MISTAALAIAGVLAMFGVAPGTSGASLLVGVCTFAFAGVAGFSLWVSMEATACAQVLSGPHTKAARRLAWAVAAFTGTVSIAGAHLGYAVLTAQRQELPPMWAVDLGGLGLAFVKPAMAFVIEACVSKERGEEKASDVLISAKDNRIRELEAQLRAALSQQEKPLPANDVEGVRVAPSSTAKAAAKALREAPLRDDTRPQRELRETVERGPPLSEDAVRQILAEMTATGQVISFNSVRKFAGVPYSRVERSPGRHLIEAAKAA